MSVTTEQAKHSPELLSAVERALAAHNLRLKPDQDLGSIADAVTARGIKLIESHGYLSASQTTAGVEMPMHVNQVIEGLATQEPKRFYPREVGGVTSREELDHTGKIAFIREHGLQAWEKLPAKGTAVRTVVLDPRKMKRGEWLSLSRQQKADFLKQYGADSVGQIMARK